MDAKLFRYFFTRNLIFFVFLFNLTTLGQTDVPHKLRLCMVAARDTSAQVAKLCADLDSAEHSRASCSIAPDRLTCLRRVARGKADFATFQVEDILVAARRNADDLAVTNQLRTLAKPLYEYEVAAIVRNSANITTLGQLRNSTFCHPGFGYETDWTGVVSRFLEVRVVPQSCDDSMTLVENSLNSSADFFRAACKAGPWVPDPDLDAELKSRYPSLCAICDNPTDCSTLDKYWGRLGPLYCLTDGYGDVLWARLSHIKTHFAPEDPSATSEASLSDYSFLCPDGSLQSLQVLRDKDSKPCVWMSRPWPVVIANSKVSGEVQSLVRNLAIADLGSWERALLLLVAPLQQHTPATPAIYSPEEMLGTVSSWLQAATVNPCGIDGTPTLCVKSGLESSKCQWLTEAARAYGVRGAPFCVSASHFSAEDCVQAVADGNADMTIVSPDQLYSATRHHNLKVLLYERPDRSEDLYLVSAVVTDTHHWTLADLRGKRACFPSYNGASWQLVLASLRSKGMISSGCDDVRELDKFFLSYCVNDPRNSSVPQCPDAGVGEKGESGDYAALRCLAVGHGDVAFVDKASVGVLGSNVSWARNYNANNFHFVFINLKEGSNIGWAPQGMLMVRASESGVRLRQWRTMLERLDEVFGPNHRTPTPAMQMFATFDGQPSIIFHNSTRELVDYDTLTQDTISYSLDLIQVLQDDKVRCPSCSHPMSPTPIALLFVFLIIINLF